MEDWSWVERYQTLISGILAICAALIAAVVIYLSAQAPLKAERRTRAEEAEARRRAHALALRVEVQDLVDKAGYMLQEARSPTPIRGGPKKSWYLDTPASFQDWHLAAAHPPPIPDQIASLILTLRRCQDHVGPQGHNGGNLGAIYNFMKEIDERACDLIKAIDDEYGHSTPS